MVLYRTFDWNLGKVGFILAHSHISELNNFLIICETKLFFYKF